MNDQVFQLLQTQHKEILGRFDRLEAAHDEHLKEDHAVHKMVERHTLYFNIALLGIPVVIGAIAKRLGFEI